MKKYIFSTFGLLFCMYISIAQQLPNRYLQDISSSIQITEDVIFSTNIPTVKTFNLFGNYLAYEDTYGQKKITLRMNIYSPSNDTLTKRPVIIFAFGGGFVNGSRTEKSMIALCKAFAKRGFITATIDYRLGLNIGDQELSKRAVYRALQDGRSAVRFFRKNANNYGIDPNQIYISGHSAGAFLAYHSVYLDKDSERPASTRNYFGRPDLGGLDEIGDNKTYNDGSLIDGKANGVMGFAGALGDLSYIENSSDVPGVYFHSSNDLIVPYNSGEPFSFISWLPGFNLPTAYGSNLINNRANNSNTSHAFYSYTNRGHNVHFNGFNLYSDIAPNGSMYFYNVFLKPSQNTISGNNNICNTCLIQNYTANGDAFYYDWQITGGVFINKNPYNNIITVLWNANTTSRILTVTPYSRQLARGNTTDLQIKVNTNLTPKTTNEFNPIDLTNITIGPNPFKDNIEITISNEYKENINFVIVDLSGRIIEERKVLKDEPSITEIFGETLKKSGFYFIQITSENKEIKIYKIIKE